MIINLHGIRRPPVAIASLPPPRPRERSHFASQWLWAKQSEKLVGAILSRPASMGQRERPASVQPEPLPLTRITSDKWGFGWSWGRVASDFPTLKSLYNAILGRRKQIFETKELWRGYIEASKRHNPLYSALSQLATEEMERGSYRFVSHRLLQTSGGISGSYFLTDINGVKRFVVKPIDEDIGCLNNRKGFSSPYTESTLRDHIPLYLSAMRETLAYEIATSIGVAGIAPRTALAILECDAFADQLDCVAPEEKERYESIVGSAVREKLCAVQEFVPQSKSLFEGLHELQQLGLSDAEIAARFDQRDVEDACLLLWTTGETDGHSGNFLVYPKSHDSIGNEILGIKKIDNGLAFPEKNSQFQNSLRHLPNAKERLSEAGRAKIAALNADELAMRLQKFGLGSSVDALRERIALLKTLSQRSDITLKEIDQEIGKSGGAS